MNKYIRKMYVACDTDAFCVIWNVSHKFRNKPCVLVKLYKSVVLPTVLYGYEMWNNLKSVDLTNLNRFQHFIVKRIQNLRTCTRSDMCQSLHGIHPISSYIDTRKLLFLQKLCSLDDNFLTKRIFMTRLFSYFADNSRCLLCYLECQS
jgi:hypothetical protein